MTAQVSATESTVAGGTVTFTDTYNSVTEVLGTVQVQSTNGNPGTAILEIEVGGVGVHQFVANYGGTAVVRNQFVLSAISDFFGALFDLDRAVKLWYGRELHAYRDRVRIRSGDSDR